MAYRENSSAHRNEMMETLDAKNTNQALASRIRSELKKIKQALTPVEQEQFAMA